MEMFHGTKSSTVWFCSADKRRSRGVYWSIFHPARTGEGAVSLSYQNLYVRDHVFSKGETLEAGHIRSQALVLDVDYSLTSRLAVRIELPYIAAEYSGLRPHRLPVDSGIQYTFLDDGSYHPTFQDFRVDLRYSLSTRRFALTPFFEAVVPSHGYEYFSHSSIGRGLREYHLGTNFGRRLHPKIYLQARYSYAFVERVVNIAPNRSEAELQLGYFVKPHFYLLGLGSWTHTHNGVDFVYNVFPNDLTLEQFHHHDQIGKSSLFDAGGGAGFVLNKSTEVFASLLRSAYGRNGHLHAAAFTFGLSWSFSTRRAVERALLSDSSLEPNKAFVCTCARGK